MRIASLGILVGLSWMCALTRRRTGWRTGKEVVPTFKTDVLPFLEAHCFDCHGTKDGNNKADLKLSKYADDEAVQQDRKVWDNVLHMLRSGEMPPMERKRPSAEDLEKVLASIEGVLANLDCTKAPNVGRVTLRRLNRAEYNNTIRDLVGVDFQPAADFPQDDVGYGFDNIGDVLSTTPLLFERYLAAAESVLQKVIVAPETVEPKDIRLQGLRVTRGAGEETNGGGVLYGEGEAANEQFLDAGDWNIHVEVYARQVGDEKARAAIRVNRDTVKEFEVTSTNRNQLQVLEAKVRLPAGTARIRQGSSILTSRLITRMRRRTGGCCLCGALSPTAPTIPRRRRVRRTTSCSRMPMDWSREKPPAKSSPGLPPAPSAGR